MPTFARSPRAGRRLGFLTVALFAAPVWHHAQAQSNPATTVFVVRHAEKGPESPDPSLTSAGRKRAETLAWMLGDAGITTVYASEFKRTQETVAPLATRLRITPIILPARETEALVAQLAHLPAGTRALVASHSNLVPVIIARLTGVKVSELTDADYDRLYVVTLRGDGRGEAHLIHFGEAASTAP